MILRFWDRLWYVAVPFLVAFTALLVWYVPRAYRDIVPLAVYPTGIDIPEEWVAVSDWDPPGTVARYSGFQSFSNVAWYSFDESRPWVGIKLGLRDGGLIAVPPGRPGRRDSFLAALAEHVRREDEDLELREVIRSFDLTPEGYDSVWHSNPRTPLPASLVFLWPFAAMGVWFPYVIFRAWSLLPVFVVATAGFALGFALGIRHLLKREVRCLTLPDPGTDRFWSFLERSFAQMGYSGTLPIRLGRRPNSARSYSVGSVIVHVDRLWGEGDPWVQWRIVVDGPGDGDAVRDARRALARFALEEGLLPTTNDDVQNGLADIRETRDPASLE